MKHNSKFLLTALLLLGLVSAFDQPAGTKLWDFYVGHPVQSSPALGADGAVFFGADNGKLYAFDPQGSGKWEFPTGDALVASPALATDGSVVIGSLDGYLYAVAADGVEKWRFRSNGKIVSSPALGASNSVFFGTMAKTLYAVNGEGAKRWELELDDAVVSSPAVARDGTIYVASLSGVLYAVDFWGKVKWKFKASDKVNSSPAIGPDGTVYFGAFDGHVYALKPNGQKLWTFATGAAVRGSAAVGPDGVVYVGSDDRKLYAFAPDGFKLWSYTTGGWVRSTPAVGRDGTIYVGSYDNSLHAVSAAGLKVWEFATDSAISSSPALAPNGVVYFGGWNKRFYAVRGGEGLAPNAWAKFRGDARQTAAQNEFAPMPFVQPAVRPAFPVEDTQPSVATSKAATAEELARAQAARAQALAAKKEATARTKAAAVPPPVAPKPTDTSAEAKRLAKAQAEAEAKAARDAKAARTAEQKAEAEANRKMLADNDRVLKDAALARKAQEQDDYRRALSAGELARNAKRDAGLRDAATRKAIEAAELQARTQQENERKAKEAEQARLLAEAKAQTEADRKAAMETARLTKLQQEADRKAAEAKAKADARAEQEAQQRALKETEQARQLQQADEARRAAAAAEQARTAKKEADQRAAAKQAAELAETKRLQAEAVVAEAAQRKAAGAAALQAKAQAEAERKAAMETARQVKVLQDAERQAAEAKVKADAQAEIENSKRVLEASRRLLKEAEVGRKAQEADEARRALAAAELARTAKKESDQRTAAKQAAELAEAKRLQAEAAAAETAKRKADEAAALQAKAQAEAERRAAMEAARLTKLQHEAEQAEATRKLAAANAQAEAEAKALLEAERHRAKEQEIARKVMADSEQAAREQAERQLREVERQAAREQAAERKRIEAERQKWEPVSGGFFRSLFGGGGPREPKTNVAPPATPVVSEPAAVPPPVPVATQRQAAEEAALQAKAQADAERRATAESARQAKLQQDAERKAQDAERRRVEAERQKWEPAQGGFFRRLFGFGSSEPKVQAEAPAAPAVPAPVVYAPAATAFVPPPAPVVPVPVVVPPVAPPPAVTAPVAAAPSVPLKIISDSAEVVRPAAPAASFFTPAQPTVDPLAAQIELLKQRAAAAQAQAEPQFVQPVVVVPPVALREVPQPVVRVEQPEPPEQPGFWSRVGSFFIRSKKDQQARTTQPQTAPRPAQQRPPAAWPPANTVALDPQAPAQVPAGLASGGVTATNFPRVQYEPVTNQNNLFLSRAQIVQPGVPGMPQPPAPPREVREMRPGKTGSQGLAADLPGANAPIEIIQGRIKSVVHVYATGAGRVAPDLNGAELEVGQAYTLEALPARGAVFVGWTGSVQTNTPVLRFIMRTGTTLTANFQFNYNLERELPEVAITSPADGTRLTSPAFILQGAARDNVAVARVDVSINNGPWEPAQGTDNWGFQGAARPGPNTVRVRAVDQAGNESLPVQRTLHYAVESILTVRVNGAGTVTPDGHGRLLNVGSAYEVRATPAAGHVFTGWSGGVSGTSPTLQFTMQTNLVLEANFAPRAVSLARGVFNGLLYPTSSLVPAKCGFFQVEVAADGGFTGFLRQGNTTQQLSGRFDANGQATTTVLRVGQTPVTLSLQIETTAGERLMGRFDDDGTTVDLFAYRQVFDGLTSVTPLSGRYTFVMPGPTNVLSSPAGDAFGEIVVDGAGRVKFAGELPDGTPVRHEAFMARNGLWPLHVPLAGGRGMLLGWITISKDPSLDAFGEVIWHKPLTPQDRFYPAGFSTRRHLFGNLYTPMAKASSGGRTIGGMLSGGNLDKVVLGNNGSPLNLTVQQFNWNFRPDSGFVDGTFIHPTTKEETAFRGALLQKRGWTSGYFLGQNQSGVVHLQLPQ